MSTIDDSSNGNLVKNATKSTMKVEKVTHEWTIDNFDFCEAKGSFLKSPEFSSSKNGGVKWYLILKPNGETDDKDAIGLYLYWSKESEHEIVFAKFSASILNTKKNKQVSLRRTRINKFGVGGSFSRGWGKFCEKDDNFRDELLSNNVLKISCEIMFSTESDVFEHQMYCNTPHPISTFADRDVIENLDVLFKTHLLSDVVISAGGKDHQAHKAILAARSKVFAAMFQHDTKENQLNRIEIEDMSEEVVIEMLRFIYTGRCPNVHKLAGGLLVAADKYDLDLLKTICSETLCENLSIENAAQNLIFADMHNANHLKNEVTKLIVAEPSKVFNTAGWKSVEVNPLLLNQVCQAMARKLESSDNSR